MVDPYEPCETLLIIQLSELVEVAANYFISGADQKREREREREKSVTRTIPSYPNTAHLCCIFLNERPLTKPKGTNTMKIRLASSSNKVERCMLRRVPVVNPKIKNVSLSSPTNLNRWAQVLSAAKGSRGNMDTGVRIHVRMRFFWSHIQSPRFRQMRAKWEKQFYLIWLAVKYKKKPAKTSAN